jgi:UDP:flavonoid glycosyltransferase YjiC (YdhE family)
MLVSMGSTGSWEKIVFLNDPIFERFKIIASGDGCSTLRGPNIISRPFLNNVAIMDKIDVLICHGGNGTLYQALSHGVPALCITSNFEQEWNVQRIEELGLGASINDISDAKEIYKLIDLWITKRNIPPISEFKKTMSIFSNDPTELPSLLAAR